jgi:hypothetical protein
MELLPDISFLELPFRQNLQGTHHRPKKKGPVPKPKPPKPRKKKAKKKVLKGRPKHYKKRPKPKIRKKKRVAPNKLKWKQRKENKAKISAYNRRYYRKKNPKKPKRRGRKTYTPRKKALVRAIKRRKRLRSRLSMRQKLSLYTPLVPEINLDCLLSVRGGMIRLVSDDVVIEVSENTFYSSVPLEPATAYQLHSLLLHLSSGLRMLHNHQDIHPQIPLI